jgi:hypothetical protein
MSKPTPIDRTKFENNLKETYDIPEQVYQPYNSEIEDPQLRKQIDRNNLRANEISTKGTQTQDIKIELKDIDSSILYHLQKNIIPQIKVNDNLIEVPILYASPERWKSIQKDGYYRDKNGKIQTPLIVLKRDYFSKDRSLGNKLDGNKVNNVQYFKKGWSKRNVYDNFNLLQGQRPQEEYQVTVIPDYIDLKYSLLVFTDYIEHTNNIVEAIEYASDSYWGDKEKFLFRTFINDYPTPIDVEAGNDRLSKSEMSLNVKGYIIPKNINIDLSAPSKLAYNKSKIVLSEFVLDSLPTKDFKQPSYIKPPCKDPMPEFIKIISGTENIIPISEHGINPIASIEVYDSDGNEVFVLTTNNNGLVSVLTNVPLDNHKLVIS